MVVGVGGDARSLARRQRGGGFACGSAEGATRPETVVCDMGDRGEKLMTGRGAGGWAWRGGAVDLVDVAMRVADMCWCAWSL